MLQNRVQSPKSRFLWGPLNLLKLGWKYKPYSFFKDAGDSRHSGKLNLSLFAHPENGKIPKKSLKWLITIHGSGVYKPILFLIDFI